MNYKMILGNIILCTVGLFGADAHVDRTQEMQVVVQAQKNKKVAIGFVIVGHHDHKFNDCIARLKKDLEWSGQCQISLHYLSELKHENDLKNVCGSDVSVAVILSHSGSSYSWRLYDVSSLQMIVGKKQEQGSMSLLMRSGRPSSWINWRRTPSWQYP